MPAAGSRGELSALKWRDREATTLPTFHNETAIEADGHGKMPKKPCATVESGERVGAADSASPMFASYPTEHERHKFWQKSLSAPSTRYSAERLRPAQGQPRAHGQPCKPHTDADRENAVWKGLASPGGDVPEVARAPTVPLLRGCLDDMSPRTYPRHQGNGIQLVPAKSAAPTATRAAGRSGEKRDGFRRVLFWALKFTMRKKNY